LAAAAAAAAAISGDPGARKGTADWSPAAAVRAAAKVGSSAAGSWCETAVRDDEEGLPPVDVVALPLTAESRLSRIVGNATYGATRQPSTAMFGKVDVELCRPTETITGTVR